MQAPMNVYRTWWELQNGKFKSDGFYEFDLYERGKKRHIRSVTIKERVVQKCLCDNVLVPVISRSFIYDNGATMKDKGYDFAINRLTEHLHRFYRRNGNDGYILIYDFSKFFDNVSHEVIKSIIGRDIKDPRIIALSSLFIDAFGNRGLGLGSQISQVMALASASALDHAITQMPGVEHYGRYMDDGYIIAKDKATLHSCLSRVKQICEQLGIQLNTKKTHIHKIRAFSWLKVRWMLTDTGKVVKRICKSSITRMRRKLKSLRRMLDAGRISYSDVFRCWQSWKGCALRVSSWRTVQQMGSLYERLFVFPEVNTS